MASEFTHKVSGVGLGLRRDFLPRFWTIQSLKSIFGNCARKLAAFWRQNGTRIARMSERFPLTCHGLSLDLGGPHPLDEDYVRELKDFFDLHQVPVYTEHLSYCGDSGHMYDLMPIPFTEEAVKYAAGRIRRVQDILERKIGVENVSFYAMPTNEMTEEEFVNAVVQEADCGLLFDVNNTYVNSINHQYDAMPL